MTPLLKDWPAGEPVPAISIRQPWAACVVWMHKDVENRSRWPFKHRGPILIHASKAVYYREDVEDAVAKAREDGAPEERLKDFLEMAGDVGVFAQGAIVGVARLADVLEPDKVPDDHPMSGSPWGRDDAGFWLHLADVVPCVPVPFKGQVGLFKVPYEVAASLGELDSATDAED